MRYSTSLQILYICLTLGLISACSTAAGSMVNDGTTDAVMGMCSYIASSLNGNLTASGEIYDETELTAAHRTYPFGTRLRVTNLSNHRQVVVRINDRGPFIEGRILDVSLKAAKKLGFVRKGVTRVKIEVLTN